MPNKKTKTSVKKKKKNLVWAGAQVLMKKPENEKEAGERRLIMLAAKVLNVSPFGVNILGNVPYINKLGLTQKTEQYEKGVVFLYNWIKRSQDDIDKAICEARVMVGKLPLTDWISGECSPASIKMSTLKGYQNHMAQTRAKNRAILEAFGTRIHEEMMSNIAKLIEKKEMTEKEATKVGEAAKTSMEEVQLSLGIQNAPEATKNEKNSTKVEELKSNLKGQTDLEKLADLKKRSGISIANFNITERHAGILIAGLLNSEF